MYSTTIEELFEEKVGQQELLHRYRMCLEACARIDWREELLFCISCYEARKSRPERKQIIEPEMDH